MIEASKKRIFLAIYINFVMFSAIVAIVNYLVSFPAQVNSVLVVISASVAVLIAFWAKNYSLGHKFLSISPADTVPNQIKYLENYWTMALAAVLAFDGIRQMVRWTEVTSWPFFGFLPQGILAVLAALIIGGLSMYCGYLIFKLKSLALPMTIGYLIIYAVNITLSKGQWSEIIAIKVTERRNSQSLSVDEGLISFLQQYFSYGIILTLLLAAIVLYRNRKNFQLPKFF